jgi:hypothetical protein
MKKVRPAHVGGEWCVVIVIYKTPVLPINPFQIKKPRKASFHIYGLGIHGCRGAAIPEHREDWL